MVNTNVVVGVDAHRRTHTLVAVDPAGLKLGPKTIATTSSAHADAVRWAAAQFGSDILWAVEDCRTLTTRLEDDLLAAGQRVVRVAPHLMSRTRASARERGKSDPIDALAVARTVLREPNLPVAVHDPVSMKLRLLVDRRDDLVGQFTATVNRLMGRIHLLDPGHPTPRNWKVQKAHRELRDWLITEDGLVAELAVDELDDIIRMNAVILELRRRIIRTVRPVAPDLIALQGCGELTAARIIAEVANIDRFCSEAAFARYAGLAPVPHTSGSEIFRLRPTRQGNRRLNAAIHRIAHPDHPRRTRQDSTTSAGSARATAANAHYGP